MLNYNILNSIEKKNDESLSIHAIFSLESFIHQTWSLGIIAEIKRWLNIMSDWFNRFLCGLKMIEKKNISLNGINNMWSEMK